MKQWSRFFFLLPLLFAGAFSVYLFSRPKLIFSVGMVVLWAGFGIFVIIILYVVGTLSYLRITHRKPQIHGHYGQLSRRIQRACFCRHGRAQRAACHTRRC